ncbi:MAG TPA: SAM-dependent methyltransferase [Candidatus Caccomonas pullistercoris]|nr:SAM-dependent methyltransferase [Candidatus Caccomonas pullistercoris]
MEAALYLIPVTLGDTPLERVLPSYNRTVVLGIRHFIVEEVRTARRFLKQVERSIDIDALTFYPMGKHADAALFARYLEPLRRGEPVGVISEAGCPAVADPGADVVAVAQREGLKVVPLVGPSSILLAVMASGFNGQSFAFHGYLPIDPAARTKALKRLESLAISENQTQLFIETPYRNARMVADIMRACRPQTRLCVAAGLTTPQEYVRTLTVKQWRETKMPELAKVPAIFVLYK